MIKKYLYIFAALFFSLLLSCGGYNSHESKGEGSITFKIGWQGAKTKASSKRNAVSIDCTAIGVSTVQAAVYDVSNNSIASGGPWPCSAHSGAITNVKAGTNRKVVFTGKDAGGNTQYRGETAGITVEEGKTSDAGTITMKPSIEGTWAAMKLMRQSCGGYGQTSLYKITLNNDGTGTFSGTYKDGNVTPKNTSGSFTYSTTPYSDGSQILTLIVGSNGGVSAYKAIISDDKNVMIFDGTYGGDLSIWVWVKMDSSKTYTNADFSGDYFGINNGHSSKSGENPPTFHRVEAVIFSSNGSGGLTVTSSSQNNNGTISSSTSTSTSSYSINSDGSGIFGTDPNCNNSYLSGDGKLLLWSDACSSSMTWGGGIIIKKGDKAYSTSDLSGTWAFIGLGDRDGTSFWSTIGTVTCNSSGSCSNYQKIQHPNGTVTYQSSTSTLPLPRMAVFHYLGALLEALLKLVTMEML